MDFPTLKTQFPESVKYLELALRSLAANTISSTLCYGNPLLKSHKIKSTPAYRHSLGIHHHPLPEIAIVLEGECFLEFENGAFAANPGSIFVSHSQMKHCEGIFKKTSGYCLLWLSFAQQGMLAFINRYTPRKGWEATYRWAYRDKAVKSLFERLRNTQLPPIQQWYIHFRSNLLLVLAGLYRQNLDEINLPPGSKKSPIDKHEPILREVKGILDNHYTESISLEQMAESTGLSPNYLNKLFSQYTGMAIHSYIMKLRMEQAAQLLKTKDMLAKQVAGAVGYDDPLILQPSLPPLSRQMALGVLSL